MKFINVFSTIVKLVILLTNEGLSYPTPSNQQFSDNWQCSKETVFRRIPHPSACRKFIECRLRRYKQYFMETVYCPGDTLFDEIALDCVSPEALNPNSTCAEVVKTYNTKNNNRQVWKHSGFFRDLDTSFRPMGLSLKSHRKTEMADMEHNLFETKGNRIRSSKTRLKMIKTEEDEGGDLILLSDAQASDMSKLLVNNSAIGKAEVPGHINQTQKTDSSESGSSEEILPTILKPTTTKPKTVKTTKNPDSAEESASSEEILPTILKPTTTKPKTVKTTKKPDSAEESASSEEVLPTNLKPVTIKPKRVKTTKKPDSAEESASSEEITVPSEKKNGDKNKYPNGTLTQQSSPVSTTILSQPIKTTKVYGEDSVTAKLSTEDYRDPDGHNESSTESTMVSEIPGFNIQSTTEAEYGPDGNPDGRGFKRRKFPNGTYYFVKDKPFTTEIPDFDTKLTTEAEDGADRDPDGHDESSTEYTTVSEIHGFDTKSTTEAEDDADRDPDGHDKSSTKSTTVSEVPGFDTQSTTEAEYGADGNPNGRGFRRRKCPNGTYYYVEDEPFTTEIPDFNIQSTTEAEYGSDGDPNGRGFRRRKFPNGTYYYVENESLTEYITEYWTPFEMENIRTIPPFDDSSSYPPTRESLSPGIIVKANARSNYGTAVARAHSDQGGAAIATSQVDEGGLALSSAKSSGGPSNVNNSAIATSFAGKGGHIWANAGADDVDVDDETIDSQEKWRDD